MTAPRTWATQRLDEIVNGQASILPPVIQTLRLGGLDGASPCDGMPWVNHLADAVAESCGLQRGVALPAWDALVRSLNTCLSTLCCPIPGKGRSPSRFAQRTRNLPRSGN